MKNMKKKDFWGYVLLIIIGVISVLLLMINNEHINEQQENKTIEQNY